MHSLLRLPWFVRISILSTLPSGRDVTPSGHRVLGRRLTGSFPSCPGLSGLGSSEEFCSVFCRMTLDWELSDVLLVVGRGPGFGEERAVLPHHLVKGTSVSTTSLLMLTLIAWLGSDRHFSGRLPLSVPFLHRSLCHTRSPHLRRGSYIPP